MPDMDLLAPLSTLQWIEREKLKPNHYDPNRVGRENLALLTQSILTNGWTLPLVVRPDLTIIDGFHRWTVRNSAKELVKSSHMPLELFLLCIYKLYFIHCIDIVIITLYN